MKWLRFMFAAVLLYALTACSQGMAVALSVTGLDTEPMANGSKGTLQFWRFTDRQQQALAAYATQQEGAALLITLDTETPKKTPMPQAGAFGFLFEEDFDTGRRLRTDRAKRAQVSADFAELAPHGAFSLLLCMNRDGALPAGFYVESAVRFTVLAAAITEPAVGFDYTRETPLYAFAPNGGTVTPKSRTADLSGVPLVFPAVNTTQALLPTLYVVTMDAVAHETSADDDMASDIHAVIGGERLTLRSGTRQPQRELHRTVLPCAALRSPFSSLTVTQNAERVLAALVCASDRALLETAASRSRAVLRPIPVDPGLIMEWRQENWRGRDYELFAWDRFPRVLLFDTVNYAVQNDFFRRLAFFTEKAGYRGKLMSDTFLEKQHGYNAHDYRAESLADFFERARVTDFPLNERELLLKEILAANGIIVIAADGTVTAGDGAIISISQESPANLRWTFIAHEGWHGIFFCDADFRNTVAALYYTMDQQALGALIRYFAVTPTLNYDTADEYLMKNEFMAYMLQRPLDQVRQYYLNLAARNHAQQTMKRQADYLLRTNADGFVSAATLLAQYVGDRWNLAAGRVWLVSRTTSGS